MIKWSTSGDSDIKQNEPPTSGTSINDSGNNLDKPPISGTSTNDSGNNLDKPPTSGTSSNDSGNKQNSNSETSSTDSDKRQRKCHLGSRYSIVSTTDKGEASNFYLKPIVHCTSDKYFWIVTDPEDRGKRKNPPDDKDHDESMLSQRQPRSDKCKPKSNEHEPQRYVRVCSGNLIVELNVNPHSAKKSAFKLKNPRDDQTYPLHKSQWLPEALRGSQPYIIGREGKSFRTGLKKDKVCSVYMSEQEGKEITYGKHEEGGNAYGFFMLESGHKT